MFREDYQCVSPPARSIVREKSKSKVAFELKIGVCVVGGYTFIDHFSWDAYNESGDMERHIKAYYEHFEYLPITCYADKIYMNRENRSLLKRYHIRAAGKPQGRPSKEMQTEACRKDYNEERPHEALDNRHLSNTGKK